MLTSTLSPVALPLLSMKTLRRVVLTVESCSSLRSSAWRGPRNRPYEMSLTDEDDLEKSPIWGGYTKKVCRREGEKRVGRFRSCVVGRSTGTSAGERR